MVEIMKKLTKNEVIIIVLLLIIILLLIIENNLGNSFNELVRTYKEYCYVTPKPINYTNIFTGY